MTTYIDTTSLGGLERARIAAEMAGIYGLAITDEATVHRVLVRALAGDTVYCGREARHFWRMLDPGVQLRIVDAPDELDAVTNRRGRDDYPMCAPDLPLDYLTPIGTETARDGETTKQVEKPYRWTLVDSAATLQAAKGALGFANSFVVLPVPPIGLDVETDVPGDRPNEMKDILVGVGVSFGEACFYGNYDYEPWRRLLIDVLPHLAWVGHNAKYDYVVLRRHGIPVGPLAGDGRLAAYLLGEPEAGLKALVRRHLGYTMTTYKEMVGTGKKAKRISELDPHQVADYNGADCYFAVEIERLLRARLPDKMRVFYEQVELPLVEILYDMQREGIGFDRGTAAVRLADANVQLASLRLTISALAGADGFVLPTESRVCKGCRNGKKKRLVCPTWDGDLPCPGKFYTHTLVKPGSHQQLVAWLHDTAKLPVRGLSKTTGEASVDALALLRLQDRHHAIPLILTWKALDKERQFLEAWLAESEHDGRLHTNYNNARVKSGRLSSEAPNLQQVKLEWRDMFHA